MALQPTSAEATYNVANALKLLGRFDGAQTYYRAALELNPAYAGAWTNLGNVLREGNDLDGALTCPVLQAEALRPASAAVQLNLGHLLRDRGDDMGSGARRFARALELDPQGSVRGAVVVHGGAAADVRGSRRRSRRVVRVMPPHSTP